MAEKTDKVPVFGIRHLQTGLLFIAVFFANFTERNVPIALVAMTVENTSSNSDVETFDWSPRSKQLIISSFYWGYVVTLIPGGLLSKKFGSKLMLFISILISTILSLITPIIISNIGWKGFCCIRVFQGLMQGMVIPIVMEHVTKWSPQSELTLHTSLSLSGVDCGTIAAMGLGGIIGGSYLGWPAISYTSGIIGLLWCLLWFIFGRSSPENAYLISISEKAFILRNQNINDNLQVPWKDIFSSVAIYALLIATSAEVWGYSTMLNQTPLYFSAVLDFDISKNALYSSLPHIASWTLFYLYLSIGLGLLSKEIITIKTMRKVFTSYGMFGPAIILIGLGFLDRENQTLAVVLITALNGVNSAVGLGLGINLIDIAPNFASILMAIMLLVNNVFSFVTPLVAAVIIGDDESNRARWQILFAISAVIFVIGNLVFITFAKFEVQPWNFPKQSSSDGQDDFEKNSNKIKELDL